MKTIYKLILTVMLCCAIIGFQACLMLGIWRCSSGLSNEDLNSDNKSSIRDIRTLFDSINSMFHVARRNLQNDDRHECFYIPIRLQNHTPINARICPYNNITIQERNHTKFVIKIPRLNDIISFLKDCVVGQVCWMRPSMLKSSPHCAREFRKFGVSLCYKSSKELMFSRFSEIYLSAEETLKLFQLLLQFF